MTSLHPPPNCAQFCCAILLQCCIPPHWRGGGRLIGSADRAGEWVSLGFVYKRTERGGGADSQGVELPIFTIVGKKRKTEVEKVRKCVKEVNRGES